MRRTGLAVLAVTVLAGCRDRTSTEPQPSASVAAAPAEGAPCKEHGVLATVCTKCNPALIPVFKAKKDWCEEHGFPESFCPVCHPERGGRPANDVGAAGDGPADGTKVRFQTRDTSRLAGIRVVKAIAQETRLEVLATGRVAYDATRVAQINPRAPGVVRAIRADVGDRVPARAPLAVIESAGVGADQSRLQAARTRLEVAEASYKRVESLHADGIAPERDLLVARREREEARADVRSARAALGMVGAAADGGASYTLVTPIAGIVTQRRATVGRLVDGPDFVFEVVDPSQVWIELDVHERDAPLVRVGQPVVVVIDGIAGREPRGALTYVAPAIDPRTRTVVARLPLPNDDGALRANSFVRGRIAVTDPHASVVVPRAAVQRARSVSLVFVRLADDLYEARRVTVGTGADDVVSVSGRLRAGDDVVTDGSFLLKTETLKDSIGAGCCDVDGP